MLTILLRTVLVYVILVATMRLLGKRQLGELEVSELVTTLLISEIASLPIIDQNIPIMYAVIPLVTILAIEVVLSVILLKCPRLKGISSSRPSILIRHGELDQKELRRNRISVDELLSEIRQSGIATPEEVDYVIVEQNGRISVLPKKNAQPPSAEALHIKMEENGLVHVIIQDGHINHYNLKLLDLSREWLEQTLREAGVSSKQVFFLGRDDGGKLYWINKEEKA